MPNGKERDREPLREVFVVRKDKQQDRLRYFEQNCRPLYGSDVRVDKEGNIFYPTWRPVKEEEKEMVTSEDYLLLSKKRKRPEIYLAQRLVTKRLHELIINQITKDGGSVEAGVQSVEHGLATELNKEKPQMRMLRKRIGELFDLFADFSAVTDEQLKQAERETYRRLAKAGFDAQKVILKEKKDMANWLIKASGGKDSLERKNRLITMMALEAANRRAVERELGIGHTVSKFARMREALRFGREFSREIVAEVKERLEPQRMPALALFKSPEKPAYDLGFVKGVLTTMSWQLSQPPVKTYKPAGMKAGEVLEEVVDLLGQNRRGEIVERDLFGQARGILEEVLDRHKDIYLK